MSALDAYISWVSQTLLNMVRLDFYEQLSSFNHSVSCLAVFLSKNIDFLQASSPTIDTPEGLEELSLFDVQIICLMRYVTLFILGGEKRRDIPDLAAVISVARNSFAAKDSDLMPLLEILSEPVGAYNMRNIFSALDSACNAKIRVLSAMEIGKISKYLTSWLLAVP